MIRMTSLTNLDRNDVATLFPSLANLQPDGRTWRVGISGIVFRLGRLTLGKKLMLGILRRAMKVGREEFETEMFHQRIRGFMADAAKGRRLAVRIGDELFPLTRRTKRSGLFHEDLRVSVDRLDNLQLPETGAATPLPVS